MTPSFTDGEVCTEPIYIFVTVVPRLYKQRYFHGNGNKIKSKQMLNYKMKCEYGCANEEQCTGWTNQQTTRAESHQMNRINRIIGSLLALNEGITLMEMNVINGSAWQWY